MRLLHGAFSGKCVYSCRQRSSAEGANDNSPARSAASAGKMDISGIVPPGTAESPSAFKKLESEYGPEYESWITFCSVWQWCVLPQAGIKSIQEINMDHSQRIELEARIRQTLKDHQHEGLHMIGGVDQLVNRLLNTVEEWLQADHKLTRKSA
jgi:hypothetical protein